MLSKRIKVKNLKVMGLVVAVIAIIIVIAAIIITQPKPHPLGVSIYTNLSTLLPAYKVFYSNATSNSLLIDDEYSNTSLRIYLSYYNHPQVFPRVVFANNYSELTSGSSSLYVNDVSLAKRFNFSANDYMGYDIEDWPLTPQTEQDNMAAYTQMACNYVHDTGYKFAFTPEIDTPGWGQFAQVNWTCINLLDLQEQLLSSNPSSLVRNVTGLLSVSKAKNPSLVVFVQIDMAGDNTNATLPELKTDISDLSRIPGVNGVIIQDLCDSASCNSELGVLVNYTKSIQ